MDSLERGVQAVDEVETLRNGLSCAADKVVSLDAKVEDEVRKGSALSRPELELDPGLDWGAGGAKSLVLVGLDGERRCDWARDGDWAGRRGESASVSKKLLPAFLMAGEEGNCESVSIVLAAREA